MDVLHGTQRATNFTDGSPALNLKVQVAGAEYRELRIAAILTIP